MRYQFILFVVVIVAVLYPGSTARATDIILPPPVLNTFLPVFSNESKELRHSLPIGVQMSADSGRNSARIDSLRKSGANWVRVPLHWRLVEPTDTTPDQYIWNHADRTVAAALEAGVTLILTHGSNPAWAASSANGPVDRTSLDEVAEYLAALAERYDGDGMDDAPGSPIVQHFELYDELDYGAANQGGVRWQEASHHYGLLLRTVYPAIKAANPDAQVIFGGMSHRMTATGRPSAHRPCKRFGMGWLFWLPAHCPNK